MADTHEKLLDVRTLAPYERHKIIFAELGALEAGSAILLVNDHDPKPLYYQIQAEHAGEYSWVPAVEGPTEWRIIITKL